MLEVRALETAYGRSQVLFKVDLEVAAGEVVTLLGRNGMGKTTTVRSIMGIVPPRAGTIRFEKTSLRGLASYRIAQTGLGLVPEGRQVFPNLTVRENLVATAKRGGAWTLARVYQLFPQLREREHHYGNQLSGGEQQMLAIGRALMTQPQLMMLDEPSLGLAPRLVGEIFEIVRRLNQELGTTILIVEQAARLALQVADYGYIMENGRIVLDGPADELAENPDVQEFYLGMTESGERRSYREVKHYRRRKRWL
jgi:branched-chain amino acid transport system ATP-binding protein